MLDRAAEWAQSLLVGVQAQCCAVPLAHVIETLRPCPIQPLAGLPAFVPGVAIVRGIPTPVVDLGLLLGVKNPVVGRFVTLRLETRQVALAVETVFGIRALDTAALLDVPPILQAMAQDAVDAIGTLDARLLLVLRTGRVLPPSVWQTMAAAPPAMS